MTRIFDITRTIKPSLAVWPGDTPFSAQLMVAISQGGSINLTTITLSSHTGTHADSPFHFSDTGPTMEQASLAAYVGPASVVTVPHQAGPLTPADFPGLDWPRVERLLVHSPASEGAPEVFPTRFVYPSPELADFMGQYSLRLFGSDAPSMDEMQSQTLPGHHALYRNGIAILENLNLTGVPDGEYELIALPLKIEGADGAPVRAILRTWS